MHDQIYIHRTGIVHFSSSIHNIVYILLIVADMPQIIIGSCSLPSLLKNTMLQFRKRRSTNDGMDCVQMETALELMMGKLGDRNILGHLEHPYQNWYPKALPPLAKLTHPDIIAVVDAFAPGCPNFLVPASTLRKALVARHHESPCLPGNSPLHAKVVAQVIRLVMQVWRQVKSIEGKEATIMKKAYHIHCIVIESLFCLPSLFRL